MLCLVLSILAKISAHQLASLKWALLSSAWLSKLIATRQLDFHDEVVASFFGGYNQAFVDSLEFHCEAIAKAYSPIAVPSSLTHIISEDASLCSPKDAKPEKLYFEICTSHDQIKARVIELVKKFDRIDATKVTETADFQKDLSLDSLDRVELIMAFEEEFSIEIPDERADKLTCCADVAEYIISGAEQKIAENS
ncbi:hypothetical protein F0562_027044 [Nyssa sinensis]|uniref:Acyl carrier protein n=1 Tax=Nyssa sinensis TaxID=561372 RepID=A0A5J5B3H8_9ASTE|nr:hypothetical protein F0562_027044 [Nyssa sinensis]